MKVRNKKKLKVAFFIGCLMGTFSTFGMSIAYDTSPMMLNISTGGEAVVVIKNVSEDELHLTATTIGMDGLESDYCSNDPQKIDLEKKSSAKIRVTCKKNKDKQFKIMEIKYLDFQKTSIRRVVIF